MFLVILIFYYEENFKFLLGSLTSRLILRTTTVLSSCNVTQCAGGVCWDIWQEWQSLSRKFSLTLEASLVLWSMKAIGGT
jgi:hypothetical protein